MADTTPRPWGIERTPDTNWIGPLRAVDGKVKLIVCHTDRNTLTQDALNRNDADADFIVRSVNAHDDLLAACKDALQTLRRNDLGAVHDAMVTLAAAIAKATE